jgi:hypothetical protein
MDQTYAAMAAICSSFIVDHPRIGIGWPLMVWVAGMPRLI